MTGPAAAVLLGLASTAAVLVGAWRRRPLDSARRDGLPEWRHGDRRERTPRLRVAVDEAVRRLGALVFGVARRTDRAADAAECRRAGWAVLAAAIVLPGSLLAALFLGTALWFGPPAMAKRRDRRKQDQLVASLPEAVDLLAVGVAAGLSLGEAIAAVGRRGRGAMAAELRVAADQLRVGASLSDALGRLAERVGDPARPLVAVLQASHASGAPVREALERLADEVRSARRRRAEAAARRVPVKLLFPLVGCILPAFALLTVAPLVAGAARSLRLSPSP